VSWACDEISNQTGLKTIALSGGVFQNRILDDMLLGAFDSHGFTVLRQTQVPPNDGGISLGQVAIGRAHLAQLEQ